MTLNEADVEIWRIGTKADLTGGLSERWTFHISIKSGSGLDELLAALQSFAEERIGQINDAVPTRQRHINLLHSTLTEIETAARRDDLPLELRAENMRRASQYLGRITGDVDVEEILDVIFSQFCIGK